MATLNVNGKDLPVDADPSTPLLWALRDTLGMTGTKFGCGAALCGACTVHLNGAARAQLRHADFGRRRPEDHHHRGRRARTAWARRCRTPGSSTTWRSAATARAAR